ncbi:MAG: DNA methylase [Chloroflexota bacterium]|nr:SAM-dependent DNA methyltransferase [Chloroflexota bacterium]NOG66113.1 SAM-dependent DNA methyltransferase [Chloroflexota bacterium]GIK64420.1 MAG: DNA methylase [Chloroflexota bacterium]
MVVGQTHITQGQIEAYLFEAANILRGPVDASDFKTYIFPLLFFKRLCDVYDEEMRVAVDAHGEAFDEDHRYRIPDGCHWVAIRRLSSNIGTQLQHALKEIERVNEVLTGIFGDAAWGNKDRLPDSLLKDLIEHFSTLTLSRSRVEPDLLGRAYEFLIKKFADLTNKKAGEFYTPRSVVKLMVDILDPQSTETVYDPACGTGGMLIEAIHHVQEAGQDVRNLYGKLYGQEKNLTTSGIARMNLLIHEVEDFHIVRGDTLRQPAFFMGDNVSQFDCVIANPPFSLKQWGDEVWEKDPYQRPFAGMPPKTNGDYAWVQHMILSMAPIKGRMAVVLPHGVLFRSTGAESQIRRTILKRDLVEAVIGLGPNLFYGAGLSACILVLRSRKATERQGNVLMIDAARLFRKGRNQNTLEREHIQQILTWYHAGEDVEGAVKSVKLNEIEANDWNLSIPLYVEPVIEEETISVEEALQNLKTALNEAYAAENRLASLLKQAGLTE